MTTYYVDSAGSNTSPYETWAKAATTLAVIAGIDAAGDVIYVAHNHNESTAGALSWAWAGTDAAPTRIICASSASGEPPTTISTAGIVTTTGVSSITAVSSGRVYFYGLTFNVGTTGSASSFLGNTGSGNVVFEACNFKLINTAASGRIAPMAGGAGTVTINCGFSFANVSQGIGTASAGRMLISGGSILGGSSAITTAVPTTGGNSTYIFEGFDFSNAAAALNISSVTSSQLKFMLRNCKLPASWSGSVNSAVPGVLSQFTLNNCDSGDTNYRLQDKTIFGTVSHETTLVKTGGASDGTTTLSWKMVSNADTEWNHQTLNSPEIVKWNETAGSAITVTVDIIHDSVTNITDREIWLEVQYLGTSGTPLSLFIEDAAADYLTAAADQADSSATWTTTGMANPNTQKLNVTFTPQEKGFIHAVVKIAGASKTIYIDPELQVT